MLEALVATMLADGSISLTDVLVILAIVAVALYIVRHH